MNLQTMVSITGTEAVRWTGSSGRSKRLTASSKAGAIGTNAPAIGKLLACIAKEQRSDFQTGSADDCLAVAANGRTQIADRLFDGEDTGEAAMWRLSRHFVPTA